MNGKSPSASAQRLEEVFIGPLHPVPVNRSRFVRGYLPIGLKPAKMIEAHDVAGLNRPAHALDPPVVAARLERVPVVQRVAPALSGLAEGIGRAAGDNFGRKVVFQAKDLGMRPHVGAVIADENRDVANDANAALAAVRAQGAPLLEECELQEALLLKLFMQLLAATCAIVSG